MADAEIQSWKGWLKSPTVVLGGVSGAVLALYATLQVLPARSQWAILMCQKFSADPASCSRRIPPPPPPPKLTVVEPAPAGPQPAQVSPPNQPMCQSGPVAAIELIVAKDRPNLNAAGVVELQKKLNCAMYAVRMSTIPGSDAGKYINSLSYNEDSITYRDIIPIIYALQSMSIDIQYISHKDSSLRSGQILLHHEGENGYFIKSSDLKYLINAKSRSDFLKFARDEDSDYEDVKADPLAENSTQVSDNAECIRYKGSGGWVGEIQSATLSQCLIKIVNDKSSTCPAEGQVMYFMWGSYALRLGRGSVEYSENNSNFYTLLNSNEPKGCHFIVPNNISIPSNSR